MYRNILSEKRSISTPLVDATPMGTDSWEFMVKWDILLPRTESS